MSGPVVWDPTRDLNHQLANANGLGEWRRELYREVTKETARLHRTRVCLGDLRDGTRVVVGLWIQAQRRRQEVSDLSKSSVLRLTCQNGSATAGENARLATLINQLHLHTIYTT